MNKIARRSFLSLAGLALVPKSLLGMFKREWRGDAEEVASEYVITSDRDRFRIKKWDSGKLTVDFNGHEMHSAVSRKDGYWTFHEFFSYERNGKPYAYIKIKTAFQDNDAICIDTFCISLDFDDIARVEVFLRRGVSCIRRDDGPPQDKDCL